MALVAELRKFWTTERLRRGMSWADVGKAADMPETTARKMITGEIANPSYDAVEKMNEVFGKPDDPEQRKIIETEINMVKLKDDNSTMGTAVRTLNEVYESQIEALKGNLDAMKTMYEERIHELKESMHETVAAVNNDKKAWQIACIVLGVALAALVIADFAIGDHGWIRYN